MLFMCNSLRSTNVNVGGSHPLATGSENGMSAENDVIDSPPRELHEIKLALGPLLYGHEAVKDRFEAEVTALADRLHTACRRDLEASLASVLLDNPASGFAANHSVNVALLVCAMGLRENWSGEEMEAAICAAFTMNLSYAAQQDGMTELSTDLSLLQKSSIESHSRLSHKLLTQKKIKNREWLNAVMQHHERPDGTGYLGMRGDSISKLAMAVGLADRYCMLVSYEACHAPSLSERFLRQTVRHELDEQATRAAVRDRLGAYLPGTMVRLVNDEVAVVWRYTDEKDHPLVSSLGTQGALSLEQGIVRDSRDEAYHISEALSLRFVHHKAKLFSLWGDTLGCAVPEPSAATAA